MEWLFPENIRCIICNVPISRKNYISFCKACYEKLQYIQERCTYCGRFGKGSSMCTQCIRETYHFDRIYSVLEYNDFIHHQIYAFKYGHKNYLGKYFTQLLKDFVKQNHLDYDFITGVPISKEREKERGFNQSYLLAEEMDKEAFVELFHRRRSTSFLSGLSKVQRILELENAFSIRENVMDEMMEKFYSKNPFSEENTISERCSDFLEALPIQEDVEFFSDKKSISSQIFPFVEHKTAEEKRLLGDKKKREEMFFKEEDFRRNFVEKVSKDEENKKKMQSKNNKKIKLLIVDDILTTGSTLNELSKLAKNHISDVEIIGLTLCSARK